MSIRELEHAATSPQRFSTLITRDRSSGSIPESLLTRYLTAPDGSSVYNTLLVPGGRFLITVQAPGFVRLWDLSLSVNVAINQHALATIHIQGYYFPMLAQLGFDGSSILLLVTSGSSFRNAIPEVYEVVLTSESPQFRLVSRVHITLRNNFMILAFHADLVVFEHDGSLGLWNFSNNTWIMWEVGVNPVNAIIAGKEIVVFEVNHISIWEIPPLQPIMNGVKPMIDHKPLLLNYTSEFPVDEFPIPVPPHHWTSYSSPIPATHCEIMGIDSEGQNIVKEFILSTTQDDSPPRTVPFQVRSYKTLVGSDIYASGTLSTGEVFLIWRSEDDSLMINTSASTKHNAVLSLPKTKVLQNSIHNEKPRACGLCPSSGRLCVPLGRRIYVMDYLRAPPSSPCHSSQLKPAIS